jgi:transposase
MPRPVYRELKLLVRRRRAPFVIVQRARILLLARDGMATEHIAREVGCTDRSVRKWRRRFIDDPRLPSIQDAPRSGRPARVPIWARCKLVQLACERPSGATAPFRDIWTRRTLANALWRVTGVALSVSEVGRILRNAELRPHRIRQWLHSPDPDFIRKAKQLCDLYLKPPTDAVVVCVDEKPMQALQRAYPARVDWRDAAVRVEFEYKRHGVQVLLAAFDIRTGCVVTQIVRRRDAEATVSFMDKVAHAFPGKKVYVVWDNLSTHRDGPQQRWTRFNERHGGRFRFVYTPTHASWMNQVEIWFSILQRRVLQHGDFASLQHQRKCVEGFCHRWNRVERHPFRWTWRVPESQTRAAA